MSADRERYARACEVFESAAALEGSERIAYVEGATRGSAELRALVLQMLDVDLRGDSAAGLDLVDGDRLISRAFDLEETVDGHFHDDAAGGGAPALPDAVGDYRVLGHLGSGGMGTVYRAEQPAPKRPVALKVLRAGVTSAEVLRRFRVEGQVHGQLTHPGIAQVHETGVAQLVVAEAPAGEVAFLAMEYVPGHPLDVWSRTDAPPLQRRLEVIARVADAVQYAHEQGVIHRDLKPANILITERGDPKVIDFGIARAVDSETLALNTATGQIVGTLRYMSPEQVSGRPGTIGVRTDVYSLGIVLYELLAGRPPYDVGNSSIAEAARVIQQADPIRLSAIDLRLRGDLENIVTKALEKEPARRYESAAALAADVRHFLADEPVQARPVSTAYVLEKLARRNPVAAAMLVIVIVAAGVAAGIYRWKNADLVVERQKLTEALGRETAERSKVQAEKERVTRLKDRRVLRLLLDRADRLYPSHPERMAHLERWLEDASRLLGNLPAHQAALAALETNAGPYTVEQQARDHPGARAALVAARALAARLGRALDEAESSSEETRLDAALEEAESEVDRLTRQLSIRVSWGFDEEDAWLHELLVDLVGRLAALAGPDGVMADVRARLATAREVGPRTLDDHAAAWCDARARIRASARYAAMALAEQIGLIPLGPDPTTALEEFLHWESHERGAPLPMRGADSRLVISEATGLVFVLIPGGTFRMGAERPASPELRGPNLDPDAAPAESPVHEVTLAPYFLSKYEMTQAQWLRVTGEAPSHYCPGNQTFDTREGLVETTLQHPVEMVSWNDCDRVLGRLGLLIPTEAQWEYSARAGTTTIWTCGDDKTELDRYANLGDTFCKENGGPGGWRYEEVLDDGRVIHAPVGTFAPNRFGLFDVDGNVREWCRDRRGSYENPVNPGDGERTPNPGPEIRDSRGGGFLATAMNARVAARYGNAPGYSSYSVGVRPSRVVSATD